MKLPRYLTLFAAVLVALSLVAVACGNNDESDAASAADCPDNEAADTEATSETTPRTAPTEEFKVGYILPETGELAFLIDPMLKGLELAVQDVNSAGYQTMKTLAGDSGGNPAIANNVADKHLADGVHGIIGAAASSISLAVIDKITRAQIPMISPSNTSPTFTTYKDCDYYFRTAVTDQLQGEVMANLILANEGQNVAILYRADDYGRGLARVAKEKLEDSGATVALSISYDPEGPTQQSELQEIAAAADGDVDSVILIAFAEGQKIIGQMIESDLGPDAIDIYIPDGLATEELGQGVDAENPGIVAGIKGTRPTADPDAEVTFPDRFKQFAPDVQDLFAPHTYDAVIIMALAALSAESNEPTEYASHINDVTRGGTKCSLYADCAKILLDGGDIDYDGASGPLDFSDAGEPTTGSYDIIQFNSEGAFDKVGFETETL